MESEPARPRPMARVARWCVAHRRRVLLAWVVLLVAASWGASAAGTRQANSSSLPGTQSQEAQDLLERSFPRAAGDVDQIVFGVPAGRITDPGVRARIAPMLARVARLPHVSSVTSPYDDPQAVSRRLPHMAPEPDRPETA